MIGMKMRYDIIINTFACCNATICHFYYIVLNISIQINQLVLAVNEAKKSQDILDWKWIADKVCPGGPQDFECYLKYAQVRYEKEQTDCEDMKVSRARWDKEEVNART